MTPFSTIDLTRVLHVSIETNPIVTKKAKKAMQKHAATAYGTPTDVNDQAALHRRAQRFQREHELERNKNGGQAFLKASHQTVHRFQNLALDSRSISPTDEPEGDPVCLTSSSSLGS